jgi:hypothetical protein
MDVGSSVGRGVFVEVGDGFGVDVGVGSRVRSAPQAVNRIVPITTIEPSLFMFASFDLCHTE